MRALLKKELTEVLVPFGIAFFVIAIVWLASVRFWHALLPPAEEMLMVVALISALGGAVVGYVQFSGERWRGKLAYLCHRGTGVEGAFLAKVIAGLGATALVGFGPPLFYALSARLTSPNSSIIQWSLLATYASAATAGASFYGLGALAASLRRRSISGVLLILFGFFGIGVISELCGMPWGQDSSAWVFPALQFSIAAVLLGLTLGLVRSSVDRDLPLPRGAHVAAVLLALPLVLLPCDIGASGLKESFLDAARSEYPMIVRDRETQEIFPVVRDGQGGHFRLGPDGRLGQPVDPNARVGKEEKYDTVFYGNGPRGGSDAGPPADPFASLDPGQMVPAGLQHRFQFQSSIHSPNPNVEIRLDRGRGVLRAFGYVAGPVRPNEAVGMRTAPFDVEFGKPQGSTQFSPATVVLLGENTAVNRLIRSSGGSTPLPPGWHVVGHYFSQSLESSILLESCLLDPSDGSFWKLDVFDSKTPFERVELPGGDRFMGLQTLYRRSSLVFGRYEDTWEDPVIVGARGRYVWNGRELVEFAGSETHVTLDEAENLVRYHVVVEDPGPLQWTVRVEDVKENREVFAYDYAPRPGGGSASEAAALASVLLRSPLASTLIFTGVLRAVEVGEIRLGGPSREVEDRSEFLAGGRRPWLWALHLAVGLGCAGIAARILRRRRASAFGIALGSFFVLLLGPAALVVVWLLEPKSGVREARAAQAVPEPALVIQSA